MLLSSILLFLGFALLIKSTDFLVDGASSIAMRLSISEMAIGLSIVAFGTSAREQIINVIACIQGKTEITFGNVIGNNIVNILLIFGCIWVMSRFC